MRVEQFSWTAAQEWQPLLSNSNSPSAQLILVFGSPAILTTDTWQKELYQAFPKAHCLGCSTAGEILNTEVLDNSLVVTAITFEQTQVEGCAISLQPGESSFSAGDRLGQALPKTGLAHVFVLSDGLQVNGSELVRGLTQHLPTGVTVTGGLSGDGDRFSETYVFWDSQPQQGKIAAVGLYSDHLKVGYGSLGGWSPFGTERQITKSQGNVLYELDGQPALKLYKKYLGEHANALPATGLLFPLSLRLQTDDRRLVRTILAIDEAEQSLTFAGDMPEGTTAQLMHASFDRLVDGAIDAAETCQKAQANVTPDLAILISCVGRKLVLKQRIEEEVEGVRDVFGNQTKITGFYSYGEIAPFAVGAPCELHNQTMTITTFTEIV